MKLIIDNANIDEIRSMYEFFPMDGVTCNPTILAKEKRPPYEVLKEIRDFIEEGELHVQVVSDLADNMVEEAYKIRKELGDDTFIKIPTTKEGLKAIRILAAAGIRVTATAIYTQMQAFLAAKAGALYVAPYINRIDNLGSDGVRTAKEIHDMFRNYKFKTEVLAASFKNSRQVISLCEYGIGATTISPISVNSRDESSNRPRCLGISPRTRRQKAARSGASAPGTTSWKPVILRRPWNCTACGAGSSPWERSDSANPRRTWSSCAPAATIPGPMRCCWTKTTAPSAIPS